MRTLLAASALFGVAVGYAHPAFDGWRPAVLERPMQALYVQMNEAVATTRRTLASFDSVWLRGYVNAYVSRAETQIKRAK